MMVTSLQAPSDEMVSRGIRIYPVEDYMLEKTGEHREEILLGYSHLALSDITKGIHILGSVIRSCVGDSINGR